MNQEQKDVPQTETLATQNFQIRRSDPCTKLVTAMIEVQAALIPAKKNKENPHFKSAYADLEACWDACRLLLSENGILLLQVTATINGRLSLITELIHAESGQWFSSDMPIVATKQDMQGLGSALTYARRFSLSTIVGLVTEDDDGNLAASPKTKGEAKTEPKPMATGGQSMITPKQRTRLFTIASANGWKEVELRDFLDQKYGIKSTKDIPFVKYEAIINFIENPEVRA